MTFGQFCNHYHLSKTQRREALRTLLSFRIRSLKMLLFALD